MNFSMAEKADKAGVVSSGVLELSKIKISACTNIGAINAMWNSNRVAVNHLLATLN